MRNPVEQQLGNAPVEPRLVVQMNEIAAALDQIFNPGKRGKDRTNGFVLLVFPFEGREGRCNYISNANRQDVIVLLKEQLAYFEGQPEVKGRA